MSIFYMSAKCHDHLQQSINHKGNDTSKQELWDLISLADFALWIK